MALGSWEKDFGFPQLVQELSATLGEEMAGKLVTHAFVELGLAENRPLTESDRDRVLERMAAEPGLPGLAARVLGHRLRLSGQEHAREEAPESPPASRRLRPPRTPAPPTPATEVLPALVIEHLAATVGMEKAESLVKEGMLAQGFPPRLPMSREQCDRLLDHIGNMPGLVGLAAKVSKAKLHQGLNPLKPAF
jgi:hypothetical protein